MSLAPKTSKEHNIQHDNKELQIKIENNITQQQSEPTTDDIQQYINKISTYGNIKVRENFMLLSFPAQYYTSIDGKPYVPMTHKEISKIMRELKYDFNKDDVPVWYIEEGSDKMDITSYYEDEDIDDW
jgi:hypothetical protein